MRIRKIEQRFFASKKIFYNIGCASSVPFLIHFWRAFFLALRLFEMWKRVSRQQMKVSYVRFELLLDYVFSSRRFRAWNLKHIEKMYITFLSSKIYSYYNTKSKRYYVNLYLSWRYYVVLRMVYCMFFIFDDKLAWKSSIYCGIYQTWFLHISWSEFEIYTFEMQL